MMQIKIRNRQGDTREIKLMRDGMCCRYLSTDIYQVFAACVRLGTKGPFCVQACSFGVKSRLIEVGAAEGIEGVENAVKKLVSEHNSYYESH
jgi:hypothetical protein